MIKDAQPFMKINNEMLSRSLSKFGQKGNTARNNNLTDKQKSKHAANAANARWQKGNVKYENPRKTYG